MNLKQTLVDLGALQDEYQHTMYLAEHADNDVDRIRFKGEASIKLLKIRQLELWLRTEQKGG